MKRNNVTMKDIAHAMNLSTVTVSKALSNKDGVSLAIREKIKEKAAELGYVYNDIPKLMREGKTLNIGIFISQKYLNEYSYYWNFYQVLLKEIQQAGYYGMLEVISQEDERRLEKPIILANKKIDGYIVLGQMNDKYLTVLAESGVPSVFLDFFTMVGKTDCVVANNYFGSYTVTKHLLEFGHEHIAFIGSPTATDSILDRYLGYCKVMIERGFAFYDAIADRGANGDYIDFEIDAGRFSAYVCNNDEVAKRLIYKLSSLNLRVPEDVSVIGFDNYKSENITSIEVDVKKMCYNAVSILINHIKMPDKHTIGRFLVECKLVTKQSVGQCKI